MNTVVLIKQVPGSSCERKLSNADAGGRARRYAPVPDVEEPTKRTGLYGNEAQVPASDQMRSATLRLIILRPTCMPSGATSSIRPIIQ